MRFGSLHVRDFRNLRDQRFEPSPRFNVIAGANGQGKTNLLEAIYLLGTLRSFRGQRNAELIGHGLEDALIEGAFSRGDVRREASLRIGKRNKQVRINGKSLKRVADFFGTLNVVLFSPDDIGVLRAGPAARRLLLDRMIFNVAPAYAMESKDYEKALKSRNKLLRDDRPDRALLRVYEEQLITLGWRLVVRRRAFVERIAAPFVTTFGELFGDGLEAELTYRPNIDASEEDFEATYVAAFERAWRRDTALGYTSVGPHRDDLEGSLDGRSVATFGSQGQQRAFVLAMKIAEIRVLREQLGDDPILLLDDVSSELDAVRNRNLFDFLAQGDGQVFITTTDAAHVRLDAPTRWRMEAGVLTRGG